MGARNSKSEGAGKKEEGRTEILEKRGGRGGSNGTRKFFFKRKKKKSKEGRVQSGQKMQMEKEYSHVAAILRSTRKVFAQGKKERGLETEMKTKGRASGGFLTPPRP